VATDISSLVPSTRDLLQAIGTRRKRLALVPLVDGEDDARKLAAAGVAAFAVAAPGEVMRAVSAAVGSNPVLSLAPIAGDDDAFAARASGADAVIIPLDAPGGWDAAAAAGRSTHMAALALVTDDESAELAAKSRARAAVIRVSAASDVAPLIKKLGSMCVLAQVPAADEKALRALRGVVDAAIVESDLYLSTSFDSLREELDP
jgi:hypothetical protein